MSWLRSVSCIMRYAGSFFFGSGTGQDSLDSSLMIVQAGCGRSWASGSRLLSEDRCQERETARAVCGVHRAAADAGWGVGGAGEGGCGCDACALRRRWRRRSLTRVERRDPHNTYHMMTIAELGETAPAFDWPALLCAAGRAGRSEAECFAAGVYEGGAGGADGRAGGCAARRICGFIC